jgi:hypothetical protein
MYIFTYENLYTNDYDTNVGFEIKFQHYSHNICIFISVLDPYPHSMVALIRIRIMIKKVMKEGKNAAKRLVIRYKKSLKQWYLSVNVTSILFTVNVLITIWKKFVLTFYLDPDPDPHFES